MVKVTAKTPKRRHWRRHDVFNGNWTYLTSGSSVSVVNFEHVIADWELSSCIFSRIKNNRMIGKIKHSNKYKTFESKSIK